MRKIFSLFAALTLSVGLWAANSVITFTSTSELYPGDFNDQMTGMNVFNPNAFLDANDQVLPIVEGGVTYDDATKTGTITFAGELVTLYGSDYGDVVAFMNCSSLTSITLPEGLTSLGRASFALCSSLASVTLPESLTTIGNNVFQGCSSLASITIPANVTEIGYGAFMDCSGLTDFYVAWTTMLPTLGNIVFGDASIGTATLHVPTGTTATYAAADQWKDFGNIVEPAPTPVSTTYLDENGEEQNIDAFEVKDASEAVTWGTAGQTTWFVVKGTNVQLAKGAICNGDVRLILADGAKLTATGWYDETYFIGYAGIQVSGTGNSLTIYAQSTGAQMGQLIANGDQNAAGIGGGNSGSGSNITINGGEVTATGGKSGAGIGGGQNGSGSNITINGGEVEATGNSGAAGIGGGVDGSGSNITINGGEVTATGSMSAAGIGGGTGGAGGGGSGSNIIINGGEVTATGGIMAAGIGGGVYGSGSNITINGGEVTATSGGMAAGIGGGVNGSGSNIFVATDLLVKASSSANPTTVIAHTHTATTDIATDLADKQYAKIILGFVLPEKTAGQYATICLPRPMTGVTNGTLFKISHGDIYEVNFVEEADFTADPAGTPYLVQAEADGDIVFTMADAEPVTAPVGVETANGFVASLQEGLQDMPEGYNYLLVSGGELHSAGPGCQLSKNHAYIDINYVPSEAPAPQGAPRRVTLYNVDAKSPTALGQMNINELKAKKVINKGQFVIIRDNKAYNAQGIEVQ